MLFAARHAAVQVSGICYGQSDVPTTIDASTASDLLRSQLEGRGLHVKHVWTSPFRRTRDTAACLASRLALPLSVDARLSELAFGRWEGRPYADLERDPEFVAWANDWKTSAPPGGERLADLVDRVRRWRADVGREGGASLAITHAGVIRALRAELRNVDYADVASEPVDHLTIERAF